MDIKTIASDQMVTGDFGFNLEHGDSTNKCFTEEE